MQQIKQQQFTLTRYIRQRIEQHRKQLQHISSYYKFKQPSLLYDQQIQRRDDLEKQLNLKIITKLKEQKQNLQIIQQRFNIKNFKQHILTEQRQTNQLETNLTKIMQHQLKQFSTLLHNQVEQLNHLSPTNTMLRGYSIIHKDNQVVTSTHDLTVNDDITLNMKDGQVEATIKKVRCDNE